MKSHAVEREKECATLLSHLEDGHDAGTFYEAQYPEYDPCIVVKVERITGDVIFVDLEDGNECGDIDNWTVLRVVPSGQMSMTIA